jgi:hypothetical protein
MAEHVGDVVAGAASSDALANLRERARFARTRAAELAMECAP